MKEWAQAIREALKLIGRVADHIEKKRAAHRAALEAKSDIDRRHVERRKKPE